mmetsp:Transcript_61878/g.117068  ORF Transcript_61878/g.117068 Transcript_61878/m.117068 type:complete len:1618 (-) Transcript_61878:72-4925(-)
MNKLVVKIGIIVLLWGLPTNSSAIARPDPGVDSSTLEDSNSFLQTFQQVDQRDQSSSEAAAVKNPNAAEESSTFESLLDETKSCAYYEPLDLMRAYGFWRFLGYATPRSICKEVNYFVGGDSTSRALAMVQFQIDANILAMMVPILFVALFFIAIMMMLYSLAHGGYAKPTTTPGKVRRPEGESWNRGFLAWIYCDFVNEWVSKWGSIKGAEHTRVQASELGKLAEREDDCDQCYERLEKLWNTEVAEAGVEKASLVKVLIRYVSWQKILILGLWTGLYEAFLYVMPPIAISVLVNIVEHIYIRRAQGDELDGNELLSATLIAILLFTGVPVFSSIANTFTQMLSMRISVRMCGGLSCLIYRKAQRLPTSSQQEASCDEWASSENEKRYDAVVKKEIEGAAKGAGQKKNEDDDKIILEAPQKFSLVQVVSKDANSQLAMFPVSLIKLLITIPILFILAGVLFVKITWTFLLCVLGAFVMMAMLGTFAGAAAGEAYGFAYQADIRLRYMEELFFNIGIIKACGWEHLGEQKIKESREIEIGRLKAWFWNTTNIWGVLLSFPRVNIFLALWGYMFLNNKSQVEGIWTILPVLMTFRSAMLAAAAGLPAVVAAFPSFMRLQAYMKLNEAPNGNPRDEVVPHYVELWDRAAPLQIQSSLPSPSYSVRVQGSFSWGRQATPFLKDIDLIVPAGSSLAILGKVGSGKTSLLMAVLGELFPSADARISIPDRIAFSNQMPYIMEGTLRGNILGSDSFNAERYNQAIFASCLSPDLEILPGGDLVPIGSRGIALSGGQRARVSIARVAFSHSTVKVLDDPFSALDARTSRHVLDHYIFGDLLKNTTRIVVSQPDKDRIQRYDKVIILSEGRIACQGTPEEIMQTEAYRELLNTEQAESLDEGKGATKAVEKLEVKQMSQIRNSEEGFKLRDEEAQGRASWNDIWWFIRCGGVFNLTVFLVVYWFSQLFHLVMMMVVQRWSSDEMSFKNGLVDATRNGWSYLPAYLFWMAATSATCFLAYNFAIQFTASKSENIHGEIVNRLLHAPMDRFFDKTPVGRIMTRFSSDNMQMDTDFLDQFFQVVNTLCYDSVTLVWVHTLMPIYFTLLTLPVYVSLCFILRRYFNTVIPLRYLSQMCLSKTNEALVEVDGGITYVRAAQVGGPMFASFMQKIDDQLAAGVGTETFLRRWIIVRIYMMVAFFTTSVVFVAIWIPNSIEYGALGLCLINMMGCTLAIDTDVEAATKAQYQFIFMNRLQEYTKVVQEKPAFCPGDSKYSSFATYLDRGRLGELSCTNGSQSGLHIVRKTPQGLLEVLLVQKPDSNVFVAPIGKRLSDLDPTNSQLKQTGNWHQIASVNGVSKDASKMALEFCNDKDVKIFVESGWIADGAKVSINGLYAGYADLPQMVLKNIDLEVEPRSNVAFVGATGCGKSTLLLCMLRILERRGGSISINDIDIADVGLSTLRNAVGLVPQDPVIMNASVRSNIDPFGFYEDTQIWPALSMVGLEEKVKSMPGLLDAPLGGDAAELSFGQRQLFCLARLIVRQPRLILLDEATSALDPKSQEIVQTTMEKEFPNSTLMVIAHRLETILGFDKIVVLHQGRVVEQGSLEELKDVKGGLFAKMLAAKQTY